MRFPAAVLSSARRVLVVGRLTEAERAELGSMTRAQIDNPPTDGRWGDLHGISREATTEVASRAGYDVIIVARPQLPATRGLSALAILKGAVQEILRFGGTVISIDADVSDPALQNVKKARVGNSDVLWGSVNPVIGCACSRKR